MSNETDTFMLGMTFGVAIGFAGCVILEWSVFAWRKIRSEREQLAFDEWVDRRARHERDVERKN